MSLQTQTSQLTVATAQVIAHGLLDYALYMAQSPHSSRDRHHSLRANTLAGRLHSGCTIQQLADDHTPEAATDQLIIYLGVLAAVTQHSHQPDSPMTQELAATQYLLEDGLSLTTS